MLPVRICTVLALLAALTLGACGEEASETERVTYEVRGQVVRPPQRTATGEAAVMVVDHEDIAGYMPAMRMNLQLARPGAAPPLAPGDKIAFTLVRRGATLRVEDIERLPANTQLQLADDAEPGATEEGESNEVVRPAQAVR